MARRISQQSVAAILFAVMSAAFALNGHNTLVSYSFDDNNIETGPSTFAVFQHAKGSVALNDFFSVSGQQSIEIADVSGDGDFPELQGYFPTRTQGSVRFHFSLLVTDPYERFNIALSGPESFRLAKDGIAFWLSNKNGNLVHHSDSIPKKLFVLEPYHWYTVDVNYSIDDGVYALTVTGEDNATPLVEIAESKNATSNAGSSINKFSFVGDVDNDLSNVTYYVDDVILTTSEEDVISEPFIAPGRRMLFVDLWQAHRQRSHGKLVCLPVTEIDDFDTTGALVNELERHQGHATVRAILSDTKQASQSFHQYSAPLRDYLHGIHVWQQGCTALGNGEAKDALASFIEAQALLPAARIIALSETMAQAALGEWDEVEHQLSFSLPLWFGDARYDIALAMIYFHKGGAKLEFPSDLGHWLDESWTDEHSAALHEYLSVTLRGDAHRKTKRSLGVERYRALEPFIIAEQQYLVSIWQEDYDAAHQLAKNVIALLEYRELPMATWVERLGDIDFFTENLRGALQHYEQSTIDNPRSIRAITKLSDVYFLMGDLDQERRYREQIYGYLRLE